MREPSETSINVLGPLTVLVDGDAVKAGGPKQLAVFATLIANAGSQVSIDTLVHGVYGEDEPDRARRSVQTYVSTLRSLFGGLIVKDGIGWALEIERAMLDANRFEDALDEALRLAPNDRSRLLREALDLWRGAPYAEIETHGLLDAEIVRLGELRVSILIARIDADLASGRTAGLIGEIDALLAEHPYQERFRAQHMLALYRAGRQSEALRSYQHMRSLLVNELGIDPGVELQDLERRILEQDDQLFADTTHPSTDTVDLVGPVPSGTATFLFTDLEGSTDLWQKAPDAMARALEQHDVLLRSVIQQYDGYVFTTAGDSFAVAFERADPAICCAIEIQRKVSMTSWPPDAVLRVRMAVHTGTAVERDGDYFGPVVNRCARLMSVGHGGQVLASEVTAALVAERPPDGVVLRDLGKHPLKDLLRAEHIYQVVHPELENQFPKLRTSSKAPSRLPLQLTSFVGRQGELADLAQLVAASRLVTLAGPGGSGKTRLATEFAADMGISMLDGATFVELAPIKDPTLVADAVAAALGIRATAAASLLQTIADKIGDLEILLVLDNCEHVRRAAADVVGQLLTLSSVRVLTTSQVPLGVAGEAVYRVEPLGVPSEQMALAEAARCDAVTLFAERAQLAKPAFELTARNLGAIGSICRDLDGIPLALELAAARMKILDPDQIADRLDERFRLLAGGPNTVNERHKTLRDAIDWSYELLEEEEKALLRWCSVFAGSFDLESLEAVAAGSFTSGFDILDLLSALVDKSLVVVDDLIQGMRYRLLESIFYYALGQLEASDETAVAGLAHAEFFAKRAEGLDRLVHTGEMTEAVSGLRADRDNFRAALDYGLVSDRHDIAGRIISAVGRLWYVDGAFAEGIAWCTRLLSLDPELDPSLMASVLHTHGTLLGSWSDPRTAAEILAREVALRRRLGDPAELASALNNLGHAHNGCGARADGEAAFLEAIDLSRSVGRSPTGPITGIAEGHMSNGDFDRAMEYCRQGLEEAATVVDPLMAAAAVVTAGECALHLGELVVARAHLEDARRRFLELGSPPSVQGAELLLALVDRAEERRANAAVRLVRFFEDPEVHWSISGKFWALQVAASLLDDHSMAAEVIGTCKQHYGDSEEPPERYQPAWVHSDLGATRRRLIANLGEDRYRRHAEAGAGQTSREAITSLKQPLQALAGSDSMAEYQGREGRSTTSREGSRDRGW